MKLVKALSAKVERFYFFAICFRAFHKAETEMIIDINNSLQCSLAVDPVSFVVLPVMTPEKIKKENIYHNVLGKNPKNVSDIRSSFGDQDINNACLGFHWVSEILFKLLE